MTIDEARKILSENFVEPMQIVRVSSGIETPNPQVAQYIKALDIVSDYESTHDLPDYTQYTPIPCPKCRGLGYIEKFKNYNDGKCYLCNGRGIKLKTIIVNK